LREAAIEIAPVTADQAAIACEVFRRFGRGRHPAGLNIGDTFAYALARVTGEPLLFKGADFAQTDITSAARFDSLISTDWPFDLCRDCTGRRAIPPE
jgi:ribonuclease VapC